MNIKWDIKWCLWSLMGIHDSVCLQHKPTQMCWQWVSSRELIRMLSRDLIGKPRALTSVSYHPLCAVCKSEGITSSRMKILGACNKKRKPWESSGSSQISVPKQNAQEFIWTFRGRLRGGWINYNWDQEDQEDMIGWLAGWLLGWLSGCLDGWMAVQLTEWLTGWLNHWLAVWLVGWLVG